MGCPTHEPAGRVTISSPSRMSTTRARIHLRKAQNTDRAAQAEVGFEPTNNGFAIRPLSPLGYSAEHAKNTQQQRRSQRVAQIESILRIPCP